MQVTSSLAISRHRRASLLAGKPGSRFLDSRVTSNPWAFIWVMWVEHGWRLIKNGFRPTTSFQTASGYSQWLFQADVLKWLLKSTE